MRTSCLVGAAAAAVLAACGSSSSSSSNGAAGALAAVQGAFANYGNQSSAHVKVSTTGSAPSSFELDVTKDGVAGTVSVSGQQVGIVYVGGHGYVQTSQGGPFTQLPDADSKAFGLFTITTFSSCINSILAQRAPQIASESVSSTSATVNGTAATDYKSPDGQVEIAISSGANPLPLKLVGQNTSSSSSSSSSAANPACDLGASSSSSTSESGGSLDIEWTYPGNVTTITPPPTAQST